MPKKQASIVSGWGRLHLRYTKEDGEGHIREHSCWDRDLFLKARFAEVEDANARRKKGEPKVGIEIVTEADYDKERFAHARAKAQ